MARLDCGINKIVRVALHAEYPIDLAESRSRTPAFAVQLLRRISQLEHFARGHNSPLISRRRRQQAYVNALNAVGLEL